MSLQTASERLLNRSMPAAYRTSLGTVMVELIASHNLLVERLLGAAILTSEQAAALRVTPLDQR